MLNLKTIYQAMRHYALINDGQYPDSLERMLATHQAALDHTALVCPSSDDELPQGATPDELLRSIAERGRAEAHTPAPTRPWTRISYVYCASGLTTDAPPETVLVYEPISNHDGDILILYASGEVDTIAYRRMPRALITEVESGHNPPREEELGKVRDSPATGR
jgi:hypothetical protein